jgi:hypothetical protein
MAKEHSPMKVYYNDDASLSFLEEKKLLFWVLAARDMPMH